MSALFAWVSLYAKLAIVTLKTRSAYKANLVLDLTFQMGMLSAELAILLLIASAVHGIAGWTYNNPCLSMPLRGKLWTWKNIYLLARRQRSWA